MLIISFYYLMEKSWIRQIVLMNMAPERRIRVSRIWDEVEQKVGDWLRGQLLLCLLIGIPATIGYGLMGINFWPLLGTLGRAHRDRTYPRALAGRRARVHHRV